MELLYATQSVYAEKAQYHVEQLLQVLPRQQ